MPASSPWASRTAIARCARSSGGSDVPPENCSIRISAISARATRRASPMPAAASMASLAVALASSAWPRPKNSDSARSGSTSIRCGSSGGRSSTERWSSDAAVGMSPRVSARRPADDSFAAPRLADLHRPAVDRAQLRPVAIGLLEVVAEDLLELDLATALAVDRLCPVDECSWISARVRLSRLRYAASLITAWPNRYHSSSATVGRTNCLVVSDARRDGTAAAASSGTRLTTASTANPRPITDAGSITWRSSCPQGIQTRAHEGLHGRRDGDVSRSAGRDPLITLAADGAALDQHRGDLLDIQGVALGGGGDPLSDRKLEAAQELSDDRLGILGREWFQDHLLRAHAPRPIPLASRRARGAPS